MASIQPRAGRFQLRVKHALLPKPFFWTFDTHDEAHAYGVQLEGMLARGVVPLEMAQDTARPAMSAKLVKVIDGYITHATPSQSDIDLLPTVRKELGQMSLADATYAWVEAWVKGMKADANLAPGSIRKRVGALARVVDWHHRRTTGRDQVNPFRLLPRGYSAYGARDAPVARVDVARDRRLLAAEESAVKLALSGSKAQGRERALAVDPAFELLFDLIVDTGLRLFEAYRMDVRDVDLVAGVLRVSGSKGWRGAAKPRVVPLKPALRARLVVWCDGRVGLLFPYWDGSAEGRRKATSNLSSRFSTLFDYAGVKDFTEHDLRHEAACRWFELRGPDGRWVFSDVETCRIMGWANLGMAMRYASIRGEDLVARLASAMPR